MVKAKENWFTIATCCILATGKESAVQKKIERLQRNAKTKQDIERYLTKKLGLTVETFNIETNIEKD